jgi:hypothetical protein
VNVQEVRGHLSRLAAGHDEMTSGGHAASQAMTASRAHVAELLALPDDELAAHCDALREDSPGAVAYRVAIMGARWPDGSRFIMGAPWPGESP